MQVSRNQERQWQESILPPVQVFVEFYDDEVIDIQASGLAGQRVMKNALLIKKKVKGDRFSLITSEAKQTDINQYQNEYNQYLRIQNENQENISNGGRFKQAPISARSISQRERDTEIINFGQRTQRKNSLTEVRTGRGGVRRGENRQAHNNQSASKGSRGSYGINFGTFFL